MHIPSASEIPALDRQAIEDDVAPYRRMTADELDQARHALCRMAAEQWARWPERVQQYQDPLSAEAELLWRRLVQAYRHHERSSS